MSTTTPRLGLVKPELTDAADITAMNANWDKLDNNSATVLNEITKSANNSLNKVAVYYGGNSNKSADDLTDAFALIPLSDTINSDLYNLLGSTFAYVITLFYGDVTLESKRMQLAFAYNSGHSKMAHRVYTSSGWLPWKRFVNTDDLVDLDISYKIYSNLESIGLTSGSETLEAIGTNLPNNSILICGITANNATVYPSNYGLLTVKRSSATRIEFEFTTTAGVAYSAFYSITSNGNSLSPWRRKSSTSFSVTVPTEWTASGDYYYQDVIVSGINEVDEPIVDILPNNDNAVTVEYADAFSNIFRITTSEGMIRLWSSEAITTSFKIKLKVV